MKNLLLLFCSLLLSGVFGKDEVTSVKEGGSVTLHIEPNDLKKKSSNLVWRFNNIIIANVKDKEVFDTKDKIFSGRLEMNPQTGDLTITHITSQHSGLYHLEIIGSKTSIKNFSVSVIGEENMSVMEGDPVTLHTNATRIQAEDVIQWFKDSLIAYSNKTTTTTGRFVMNSDGSLFILKIRSKDSGVYDVNITGSKHIHKRFNVTVTESRSNGEKTGPGLLVVLILMGIFLMS
ncbi:uncharacterized protein LOC130549637 [Triplophysa rosa]|uniref:uncharacterized protein LOC130549637 n=1 Tax=Triplophysa rosa TaxID=992332 RepID=UPI0025460F7D|nr:uncharacterized protein LOC130549637 [Triplophysa rosa]